MESQRFSVDFEEQDGVKIACVNGPVDGAHIDAFSGSVGAVCRNAGNRVILDLSGMNYINSRGMGLLIEFSRQASLAGGRLMLCSPRPAVRRNIELLRLDAVLEIFNTRAEALSAMASGR